VTTVLTLESGEGFTGGVMMHDQRFSYMSDNLIYLAWSGEKVGHRTIRIVKMRGSAHDKDVRDFEIRAAGARIT
jgi:KaiC/GvpD/RAD55 family RecA-like ATPase